MKFSPSLRDVLYATWLDTEQEPVIFMLSFCSGKSLPDLQPGGCYPVLQATLSIDPNCLLLSPGRVLVKGSGHLPAGQESLGSRFLCVPNPHPQYLRGRGELNRLTLPSADISNYISSGT